MGALAVKGESVGSAGMAAGSPKRGKETGNPAIDCAGRSEIAGSANALLSRRGWGSVGDSDADAMGRSIVKAGRAEPGNLSSGPRIDRAISTSRLTCASRGGVMASSQWTAPRWYSSAPSGSTSSIRNGTTISPWFTARSTSRRTWPDAFVRDENTSTNTRASLIPSMIASLHSAPGRMSLGATQQRTPSLSSVAHMASAMVLSSLAWLMKTSWAIKFSERRAQSCSARPLLAVRPFVAQVATLSDTTRHAQPPQLLHSSVC